MVADADASITTFAPFLFLEMRNIAWKQTMCHFFKCLEIMFTVPLMTSRKGDFLALGDGSLQTLNIGFDEIYVRLARGFFCLLVCLIFLRFSQSLAL